MPKFRELARSVVGMVAGVSCLYQAEVANAEENTFDLETSANKAVQNLGKVAKLFSSGKDAADALEIRDAKLAGQASKEQMDRGVNAISSLGKDASSAVAISSGGRLYSVTNAAVAPVLTSIATSEGNMLNQLTKAQQEFEKAVLHGNSYDISIAGEKLERVRIEAAHFEPEMAGFWASAKSMVSVVSTKVENVSLAFLRDSIVGIAETVASLKEEDPTSQNEEDEEKKKEEAKPEETVEEDCESIECENKSQEDQPETSNQWKLAEETASPESCFTIGGGIDDFAKSEMDVYNSENEIGTCSIMSYHRPSENGRQFQYKCVVRKNGRWESGIVDITYSDTIITTTNHKETSDGVQVTESQAYDRCEY